MKLLDYFEGKDILDKYGIRSVESRYVASGAEAAEFSNNEPIVLKLISDKALHKSKSGLVKLNLKGPDVSKAYDELSSKGKDLKPYKIIAQKMSKGGIEIIIGGRVDPQFGKLILLGLGGIYVEVFKDFALRICPITKNDALDMINQLRSKEVITFKGEDTEMLVKLLLSVSRMLVENERITELDLNPLMIREGSYEAVDIRMITG
jgi:succinyl-CoA synthetase beta subunit